MHPLSSAYMHIFSKKIISFVHNQQLSKDHGQIGTRKFGPKKWCRAIERQDGITLGSHVSHGNDRGQHSNNCSYWEQTSTIWLCFQFVTIFDNNHIVPTMWSSSWVYSTTSWRLLALSLCKSQCLMWMRSLLCKKIPLPRLGISHLMLLLSIINFHNTCQIL